MTNRKTYFKRLIFLYTLIFSFSGGVVIAFCVATKLQNTEEITTLAQNLTQAKVKLKVIPVNKVSVY